MAPHLAALAYCSRGSGLLLLSGRGQPRSGGLLRHSHNQLPQGWHRCKHTRGMRRSRHFSTQTPQEGAQRAAGSMSSVGPPPAPSRKQLKDLFVASAIPMVGFGFMDNLVMVTAGDLIDNTFGIKFGLATLTAAACGQVVSDVCGVCFGGTVEAMAGKLGLRVPDLTPAQRLLRVSKVTATAGAALGVICGCLLGMTTLLFVDTTSKEREKKQRELDTIFKTIMSDGHDLIGAEKCSMFIVDRQHNELWSRVATDREGKLQMQAKLITVPMGKGIVGEVVRTKQVVNVADAYKDKRFYQAVDKQFSTVTNNLLAVPVLDTDGECIAVIEMINKQAGPFDDGDIRLCKMLASHVAVFLHQLGTSTS